MMKPVSNMWPKGRLRKSASNQELRAEWEWQVQYMKECQAADGKGSGRVKSAKENIRLIDQELDRRAKEDEYEEVLSFLLGEDEIGVSLVQRKMQLSYNYASQLVDRLERDGIISKPDNRGKREILKGKNNA